MSDTPLSADVYSVREAFDDLKKNFIEEESDETLELEYGDAKYGLVISLIEFLSDISYLAVYTEEESDETLELGMYGFLSAVLAKETASVIKVGSEMANESSFTYTSNDASLTRGSLFSLNSNSYDLLSIILSECM